MGATSAGLTREATTACVEITDLYRIDELLSHDERALRDTVARFVDRDYLPKAGHHFRHHTFPLELVPTLAQLGVFGATLTGYGCAGLSNVAFGLILQELERGDSGLRSFVSVQSSLCMYPIATFGSDAQKDRYLRPWPRARSSGASASPSQTSARTPGA